jgi:hypothetical protein
MKFSLNLIAIATVLFICSCSSSKKTTAAVATTSTTTPITTTDINDGSSYKKAIVVKSISEEYAYVRKVCPACKFKSQSLRQNDKKYYDVLYFDNDGTEAIYYFDINSFFGKSF